MATKYSALSWKEEKNGVSIDCSLDIAITSSESDVILLTIPGVDGSVDGYEDKYKRIAKSVHEDHGAAVVQMSNPFITSHHWESNIRQVLEYIDQHFREIINGNSYELRIMAHSAGAAIIAKIAWEYPRISQLLLINPATKLGLDKMKVGLSKFGGGKITVLFGGKDPSVMDFKELAKADETMRMRTYIIKGADHNFSGESFPEFLVAPHAYLFNQEIRL